MRKSLGFTLAEVLITLAIIGVVAAMTIPSVIINTNQQEYKTGLKKAVSVLNQAITMNMALENASPADTTVEGKSTKKNGSLMAQLAQRLNVIKETSALEFGKGKNAAFYTADGMRFEFPAATTIDGTSFGVYGCGNGVDELTICGSDGACTQKIAQPCLVVVDVNGDRRPSPAGPTSQDYTIPKADSTRISDVFSIMVTNSTAIPFGTVAQRTMFQADDK